MDKLLASLIFLLFFTGNVFGQTNIFLHDFAFSGSDIAIVSPDVGTGWVEVEDSIGNAFYEELSGFARSSGGGNSADLIYRADPASSTPDMDVGFGLTAYCVSSGCSDDSFAVLLRYQDTSNYYGCMIYGAESGSTFNVAIYKKVSGTSTLLDSGPVSGSSGDDWSCKMIGTTITFSQNSIEILRASDSSISSAGNGAVAEGNMFVSTDDMRNRWQVDYLYVDEYAVSGSDRRIW